MGAANALKKQPESTEAPAEPQPGPAPAPGGPAIYRAMTGIMRDVGPIAKSRDNEQQKYKFRGIDEVYEALQLVLANHGVCVVPFVRAQVREERQTRNGGALTYTILTVDHTFYAEDGSSVTARTVGEAMDSGDKSANKAMSAAMKYALIESFCIPTREPKDTENDSPEPLPRTQSTKSSGGQERAAVNGEINKPAPATKPVPERPWMKRLQGAITKLSLGVAAADAAGLKGRDRESTVRAARIAYLRWCCGRDTIETTLDLTDDEAATVIKKAEAGEMSS